MKQILTKLDDELIKKYGNKLLDCSIIRFESSKKHLTKILEELKPKNILEIGTYLGVTATFMAQFSFVKRVITLDIKGSNIVKRLCDDLKVKNKITYLIVENDKEKSKIINDLNYEFDLVLIDGDHSFQGVKLDFNLIKEKTKAILFHDWGGEFRGINQFIESLPQHMLQYNKYSTLVLLEKQVIKNER